MIRIIQYLIVVGILCLSGTITEADEMSISPVAVHPQVCQETLYSQFRGSFFKLAVFCDDAAGTSIGVIYHPVGNKDWYWQDLQWSQDVTAFWWAPEGNLLYVSTSGIYGSGAVIELDLVNRKSKIVLPEGYPPSAGTYSSEIIKYNTESKSLECKVKFFHREKKIPISEIIEIPVK